MQRIELSDGVFLLHEERWIRPGMAEMLLKILQEKTPWAQHGRFPRLTSYYADDGVNYTYSGVTHQSLPWTDMLRALRDKVQMESHAKFNSLLLNLYRDGKDSIGWHTDAEKELGEHPVVASISVGATRTFCLRHKKGKKKGYLEMPLVTGTLLVMGGTCQETWFHSLPKTEEKVGPRINLTFRNIVSKHAETVE